MTGTRCTCGSGCQTFGQCMRNKGFRVGYCNSLNGQDYTRAKRIESELDLYARARRQGIQPGSTVRSSTRHALDASDRLGRPFKAELGPGQGVTYG